MSGIVRVTGLSLQEAVEEDRDPIIERMDGVDRGRGWKRLKERLGLKGIGCLGVSLGLTPSTIIVRDDDDNDQVAEEELGDAGQAPTESVLDPGCMGETPVAEVSSAGMNLATALAAERNFRTAELVADAGNWGGEDTAPMTPGKVSLMRLLEETDGGDEKGKRVGGGIDSVCCVCMVRKKGAAFIPCGHTYCRVCSREVWLNRGSCPLCNRSILEILDIF